MISPLFFIVDAYSVYPQRGQEAGFGVALRLYGTVENMKVVILAGGMGTRFGYETELRPKPMIPIGGKPILWHIMQIYSFYGFKDFVLCLGYKGDIIRDYFYHFELFNADITVDFTEGRNIIFHNRHFDIDWKVTLVDTGEFTLKGGRVKRIEPYLDEEVNFLTYGDGVSDLNILELLAFHNDHGKCLSVTGVYPPSRFGEIKEHGNRVLSFEEKPQTSLGLINGGFMVFNKELFDYLTPDEDCDLEKGPFESLASRGKVMVYKHSGNWECMDNVRDMNHLNRLWNQDKAFWKKW